MRGVRRARRRRARQQLPRAGGPGRRARRADRRGPRGRRAPGARSRHAFLELGGTQCGMCTPGMLLAAHAVLAAGRPTGVADIREAIAGNLCRCTGLHARSSTSIEAVADDGTPWAERAPRGRRGGPPRRSRAPAGPGGAARLVRPSSLAGRGRTAGRGPAPAAHRRRHRPHGRRARRTRAPRRPLLDLGGLDELRGITARPRRAGPGRDDHLGGAAPLPHRPRRAAGAGRGRRDDGRRRDPQPRRPLGGNCVTASPAGDLLPVLLATDAQLEVVGPRGTRFVPADAFWTGYRRTALAPDELLAAIRIPLVPERQVRFRKVGTRRALAIAKVLVAVAWQPADASRPGPGATSASPWAPSPSGRSAPREPRPCWRAASPARGRPRTRPPRPSRRRSPRSTTSGPPPRTAAP